jgi:hypothetical protein
MKKVAPKNIYLNLQITNQQLHPFNEEDDRTPGIETSPFVARKGVVDKRDLYKRNAELKEIAEVL